MLVKEIVSEVRFGIDDVDQETWLDEELVNYLNAVINELCLEADAISDATTVGEVLASGTITLGGGGGSISQVTVNGVVITSGPVAFDTDLNTTAAALAANINAFASTPDYTAVASGAVVTIKAKAGTGANPNGYVLSIALTGMTATLTSLAGGTSLCQIYFLPGVSWYTVDPRVIQIERIKPALQSLPLVKRTQDWLDRNYSGWEAAQGAPLYFLSDTNSGKVRIVPQPKVADTADLTISRLPLNRLSYTDMNASPEIPAFYHDRLQPGVMWKAYSKLRYGQMVDPRRAAAFLGEWTENKRWIKNDIIKRKVSIDTSAPMVHTGRQRGGGVRGVVI